MMWWGNMWFGRCGMPFGMIMMPLLLLICIGIIFYSFNRRLNIYEKQEHGSSENYYEILEEVKKLRKEVEELKKEKNDTEERNA